MDPKTHALSEEKIYDAFVAAGGSLSLQTRILSETTSTNEVLFDLARKGAREGSVVFAEKQTAGRGRLNRVWESPEAKNLYVSILLRPLLPPPVAPQITLMAGVACYEALQPLFGGQRDKSLRLKWPNDLWVASKKIGGILTEMEAKKGKVDFIVVGIGINVNSASTDFSEDLRPLATSLSIETGDFHDRSTLAGLLLSSFFKNYAAFLKNGFDVIRKKWDSHSRMKGARVKIREKDRDLEGICEGLDEKGFLLVKTSSGTVTVIAGDVMWT
jgi:BirA family biotin operon repressor/biotin-[acetyl-CoA-carboxylase] ligase